MPYKNPEIRKAKHKEYSATHYQKNKKVVQASSKKSRKQSKLEWAEFKAAQSCAHCGFAHPAAIDFHHVGVKKHAVNELIAGGRYKRAYEEVKQCIPLCANCHRIHHHNEQETKRGPKPPVELITD
jgi:NADPH-dependent glutamate synthase beta subunit-like oxidoreductase